MHIEGRESGNVEVNGAHFYPKFQIPIRIYTDNSKGFLFYSGAK